jgi:hypothetical protein
MDPSSDHGQLVNKVSLATVPSISDMAVMAKLILFRLARDIRGEPRGNGVEPVGAMEGSELTHPPYHAFGLRGPLSRKRLALFQSSSLTVVPISPNAS